MLDYVVSFIIPLGYFLLATATLAFLTKRSFGKCLPLAMILSAFLLFFSQLVFGTFTVGFVVGVIWALMAIVLGVLQRKKWREFKKRYFTSGLIVFLVVYILVYIYDLNRGFVVWDELSHWGLMVKEMFRLDAFYSIDASNLAVHKDYPPIMQLFELFWVKLCGGFGENLVERALHTFELSLFIPFIAEKVAEKKNFWKSVLVGVAATFAVALTILLFDGHAVFSTIYVDYVMAMVVVYLLMTIFVNKEVTWFEIIVLMAGGSFLLLLKQMGLPLYIMVVCGLIGLVWLRKQEKWSKYLKKVGVKKLVMVVVALIVPLTLWAVWGKVAEGTAQQFELSSLSLSEFVKVLTGGGETWQTVAAENYVTAIGTRSVSTSYIQFSYVQGVVLFVGAAWLVGYLLRKKLVKREMIMMTGLLVVGSVGYAVAMMMLYTSAFGPAEGPGLASYDRYMGTYMMILILFLVMVVIWQATEAKRRNLIYALVLILVVVNAPIVMGRLYPMLKNRGSIYSKYELTAKELTEIVGEDAKVFLVTQEEGPARGYQFFLQYYATPVAMNWAHYEAKSLIAPWPVTNEMDAEEYYAEMMKEMEGYDYLYMADVNDEFESKYCEILKVCPIADGSVYKIIRDEAGEITKYEYVDRVANPY